MQVAYKLSTLKSNKTNTITKPTTTSRITRYFRVSRIVIHLLLGVTTAASVFPFASKLFKLRLIKWWCGYLLNILNIRVVSHGHTPPAYQVAHKMLFVANHISWIDIHSINSIIPIRFIAKSDIRGWPVFGYLASKANVMFISREKRQDAARIVHITANSLEAGDNLCLFPEGTTTEGNEVKAFKSSLIQAALHANAVICPVAIHYPHPAGGSNIEVAYAGETSLLESVQQVLLQKQVVVELHFLTPIDTNELATEEKDRRKLTLNIENAIKEKLKL